MRKVLVVLLIAGLLIGICCVAADMNEEEFNCVEFTGGSGNGSNPLPCGGGTGDSGGAPGHG